MTGIITNELRARARARVTAGAMLALALGSCTADVGAPEEVGGAEEALNGRIRYQATCSPYRAALLSRSMFYARTVANSAAFQTCVQNTMNARYMNCDDPLPTSSLASQVSEALSVLRWTNNNVTFECTDVDNDAAAGYQGHYDADEVEILIGAQQNEDSPGWVTDFGVVPGTEYMPWNWRAATMLHEYMHTHNYGHLDWSCAAAGACTNPTCGWTTVCGGSGTPPPGVTSIATAGIAQQEFCAWARRGDDTQYYAGGDPALPYIVSECAHNLVVESHQACGKATTAGGCADAQELRLLSSWTGTGLDPQSDTAACTCVDDPQMMAALRTNTGNAVSAAWGGSGDALTNYTSEVGGWQWLYLIDRNGGSLASGDSVDVKSHSGYWLQPDFSFDVAGRLPFSDSMRVYLASGTGVIGNGSSINLVRTHTTPVPYSVSYHYAYAGPTTLQSSTTFGGGPEYDFTLERPRRDTMVYLRGSNGLYVRTNATGSHLASASRTWSELTLTGGTVAQRNEAAFWLVDLNGGAFVSGDTVAFERYSSDGLEYLSVNGTAQARTSLFIGPTERFVVTRVFGGTTIAHGDQITLRASSGYYLTVNAGTGALFATVVTPSVTERFVFRHVSQHDLARPTW
jgi:hypothetical protein